MWKTNSDVIRHFLRIEAGREKYSDRAQEILSWIRLQDAELLRKARAFADERDDTNPVFAYTVGTTEANFSTKIVGWKREHIMCAEIYSCGISPQMRQDLDSVSGNMRGFALTNAAKFPEFSNTQPLPQGTLALVIAVAQKKCARKGSYELIDGAHRLVALCRRRVERVEAYVGYLRRSHAA